MSSHIDSHFEAFNNRERFLETFESRVDFRFAISLVAEKHPELINQQSTTRTEIL